MPSCVTLSSDKLIAFRQCSTRGIFSWNCGNFVRAGSWYVCVSWCCVCGVCVCVVWSNHEAVTRFITGLPLWRDPGERSIHVSSHHALWQFLRTTLFQDLSRARSVGHISAESGAFFGAHEAPNRHCESEEAHVGHRSRHLGPGSFRISVGAGSVGHVLADWAAFLVAPTSPLR